MFKSSFAALAIGTIAGMATVAAIALAQSTPAPAPAPKHGNASYALVLDYAGQAFILDHSLTLGDCFDAMRAVKGAASCNREGGR